ncbi:MAG: zinc-dependent peptidase, partial [Aeromonas veronii]
FAVSCECFFTDPLRLQQIYPAVYRQLSQFFSQDPAQRFPATRLLAGEGDAESLG